VAFSPDGYRLASASYDHTVRIWDATPLAGDPQGPQCLTLTAHKQHVSGVAFSPDSLWLASGSWDGTVKLWKLSTEGGRRKIVGGAADALLPRYTLRGHSANVIDVAFSPDNQTLASASWDNTVKLWDRLGPKGDSLTERATIRCADRLTSLAYSRDGQMLAIGQQNGIAIYDPASAKEIHPFKPTPAPVPGIAFGPDGRLFSAGASDPSIKVWDVAGKKPIFELRQNSNPNATVAVSPDGQLIASAGSDQTAHVVKIWNAESRKEVRVLKGHAGYVWKVAFGPKGRYLASGSWDSTVKVWDLDAPQSADPITLRGHAGFIQSLAFSPDGRCLASASGYSGHGEVKVWDASIWENASGKTDVVSNTPANRDR
jgi:WD40 repeat protein